MNDVVPFTFENNDVRSVMIDGEPWFALADVCRALEISNSRDAAGRLDDDEKGVVNTDTRGGVQELTIINEPGVYRLVFASRKAAAKRFKRWLAHDVIPSIHKTGRYDPVDAPTASDVETIKTLTSQLRFLEEMVRLQQKAASRKETNKYCSVTRCLIQKTSMSDEEIAEAMTSVIDDMPEWVSYQRRILAEASA